MSIIASAPVPAGNRLIDADTANLAVIRQPNVARRAWEAFESRSVEKVHEAAAELDVTVGEVYELALDYIAAQTGWAGGVGRRPSPGSVIPCPAWCTRDHIGEDADRMHSRDMGELNAPSGADMHEEKFIGVELEQLAAPDLPGGIDPATIYFTMGDLGGNQIESSAYLSPEIAEQLAARLFEAARLARQARR